MKYTETHEWLTEEDGVYTIGITEYAAEALGDVVFIELPSTDRTAERGEEVVVIESVKAASGIEMPCDGEIVEVNDDLTARPEFINEDPEGAAWFFRFKPANVDDLKDLLDKDAYADSIS